MYGLVTLILNAIYVAATLAIVGITLWQIKKSAKQAQDALAVSEKQAQAAINAVYEQIEESKRQAQESLYNEFKPVIVPISQVLPLYEEGYPLRIEMTNKGAGVALNMFGIFYTNGSRSNKVYHFARNYFLVPDGKEKIQFTNEASGIKICALDDFYGYPTYPGDLPRESDKGISDISRLMITYEDIFSNKYFMVFRYCGVPEDEISLVNSPDAQWGAIYEPGWEQTVLKRIDQRLDELIIHS